VKQVKDVRVFPFPGDGDGRMRCQGPNPPRRRRELRSGETHSFPQDVRVLGVIELRAILEGLRVMCIE
jgi:hypothetical protein